MTIEAFQKQIEDIYYTRDAERGRATNLYMVC